MNNKQIIEIKYINNNDQFRHNFWYTYDIPLNFNHIKKYDNVKNKEFVFCCDLLILVSESNEIDESNDYKEFEKLIKKKYWTMDNCILIIDTVNTNNVELFKYVLQYVKFKDKKDINLLCMYCCQKGLFKIVDYIGKYLLDEIDKYHCVIFSMLSGSMELYNKYKDSLEDKSEILNYACYYGNLDNIKQLRNDGAEYSGNTLRNACINGNITNMQWLIDNGYRLEFNAYYGVLKSKINRMENIKWLYQNKCPIINTISTFVPRLGTIEILEYFINIRLQYFGKEPNSYYGEAAGNKNIEMIKYLWKNKYPPDLDVVHYNSIIDRALSNNTEMVKWVINNYPYKSEFISSYQVEKFEKIRKEITNEKYGENMEKDFEKMKQNIEIFNKKYGDIIVASVKYK